MEGQAFKMTQIRKLIEQFQTAVLDDEYMSTAYSRATVEISRDRLEAAFTEGDLLRQVQVATTARAKEWGSVETSLSFRGNELAGEAGEACNFIKKMERQRLGMAGGVNTSTGLAKELADVIICTVLVASKAGINLFDAVPAKFNETSDKHGFTTKM